MMQYDVWHLMQYLISSILTAFSEDIKNNNLIDKKK